MELSGNMRNHLKKIERLVGQEEERYALLVTDRQKAIDAAQAALQQRVVLSAVNGLAERLERHAFVSNSALQSVLAQIDQGLTDGRDWQSKMCLFREELLSVVSQLCQEPCSSSNQLTVNGKIWSAELDGLQNETELVISEVNEMRLEPQTLIEAAAAKLAALVKTTCTALCQEVVAEGRKRSEFHKQQSLLIRQQLEQTSYLLDQMDGLRNKLGGWLAVQSQEKHD